jgi:hypothetical protein
MMKTLFNRRLKELQNLPNVFAKDSGVVLAAADGDSFTVTTPPLQVQRAIRGKFNFEISVAGLAGMNKEHEQLQKAWFAALNDFKERLADAIVKETKKTFDHSSAALFARSKADVLVVDENSGKMLHEKSVSSGDMVALELQPYYYDFRGSRGLRWRVLEVALLEKSKKRKRFELWN